MKKNSALTCKDLDIIEMLMESNLNGVEIARIIGRSERGTQKYMAIIKKIKNGEPIKIHPGTFNYGAVKEWARKHGYAEPVNIYPNVIQSEQLRTEERPNEDQTAAEMYHHLANDINFIAISLHDLAEFILVNFAKGGK